MNFISYVRMCNRNVVIVRHHYSNNLKHLHAVPLSSYAKHVEPGSERKSAGERGLQTSVKPRPNGLTSRRKSKQVFWLAFNVRFAWWTCMMKKRKSATPDEARFKRRTFQLLWRICMKCWTFELVATARPKDVWPKYLANVIVLLALRTNRQYSVPTSGQHRAEIEPTPYQQANTVLESRANTVPALSQHLAGL